MTLTHLSNTSHSARDRASSRHRPGPAPARLAVLVAALALGLLLAVAPPAPAAPAPSAASRAADSCGHTPRGVPRCGAYIGAAHGLNQDPSSLERTAGRTLGIRRTFYQASQVAQAVTTARGDLARGRLPWISFKLPHGWDAMVAGAGDAWAKRIARRLSRLSGPVWVAFHHEPETDGDILQWRAVQERLAPMVRRRAPNVGYTVIVTGWHQLYGDAQYSLDRIWPRVKVDLLGVDLYNRYGTPGSKRDKSTDMDKEYFVALSRWAQAHRVAWGIGEIGYTDRAFADDPRWLADTADALVARGGVAMSYFNSAPSSATGDWVLDTPSRVAAFGQVLERTASLSAIVPRVASRCGARPGLQLCAVRGR